MLSQFSLRLTGNFKFNFALIASHFSSRYISKILSMNHVTDCRFWLFFCYILEILSYMTHFAGYKEFYFVSSFDIDIQRLVYACKCAIRNVAILLFNDEPLLLCYSLFSFLLFSYWFFISQKAFVRLTGCG